MPNSIPKELEVLFNWLQTEIHSYPDHRDLLLHQIQPSSGLNIPQAFSAYGAAPPGPQQQYEETVLLFGELELRGGSCRNRRHRQSNRIYQLFLYRPPRNPYLCHDHGIPGQMP